MIRSKGIAVALSVIGIAVVSLVGSWRTRPVIASESDDNDKVTLLDDCDPRDPTWAPTGGCALEKGDVDRNEFNALLRSPLSAATVGHPAWRFDPTYLKIEAGETVEVENKGGRSHTFTEVEKFGGGFVPQLNFGLQPAPACAAGPTVLPPGAQARVTGLSAGNHNFQCCIHPWMRTLIKVKPEE